MNANIYIGQFLETLDKMDIKRREEKKRSIPGLIFSHPGFGKTTTVEMWCEYHDYNFTTLIPSNFSHDDILGLQSKTDDGFERLAPTWFKELRDKSRNGKRNILFIDELSATNELIQAPMFNLIFKHKFDGYELPENTMIVSAANYSEDLGGAFSLTAPLVNRFVVLNIKNEDVDIFEMFDNDISKIKTKKQYEEFLGLTKPSRLVYSGKRFTNWVKDNKNEFQLGSTEFIDDSDMGGVLGFISERSFEFAMCFANEYASNFSNDIWMRIVGDTLGVSNKREGKPIRDVLEINKLQFTETVDTSRLNKKTFMSVRNDFFTSGITKENLSNLLNLVKNADINNITQGDLNSFSDICKRYPNSEELRYLNNQLISKIS